jgi:hypothetical protein
MTSSIAVPASAWRALATSSPVSSTATEALTGAFQVWIAVRTSPRAMAAAAGPAVSVMRTLWCASGRVSALECMWDS